MNTRINYYYTDVSNYHCRTHGIVAGIVTEQQKQEIMDCLNDGDFFMPGQVGLDVEYAWALDPQDDHPWWHFHDDSFEETDKAPTVNLTADELVEKFKAAKENWDELGWFNEHFGG